MDARWFLVLSSMIAVVLAIGMAAIWGTRKARKLGKEYAEVPGEAEPPISTAESVFSLALMLGASGGCFFAWSEVGSAAYLVGGLGFLVLAPLWYRSPVSIKALFLAPLSGRVTPQRSFQRLDILLAFIGYLLILVALSLRLLA